MSAINDLLDIKAAKGAFKEGHSVIVIDDSDRARTACIAFPAEAIKADILNKMVHLSRGGTVQVVVSPLRAKAFELEPMGFTLTTSKIKHTTNQTPRELVSVEAREGVASGISINDRTRTIQVLGAPPIAKNIVKPGHIFPIQAREGGVLVRSALAEAALDLSRISGFSDAACFLDLLDKNGALLKDNEISKLSEEYSLKTVKISDIIKFRLKNEKLIYRIAEAKLPSSYGGELRSILYKSDVYQGEHLALVKGDNFAEQEVVVRVQPENTFADVFGGQSDIGSSTIKNALSTIGQYPLGVFVYLRRTEENPLSAELASYTGNSVPSGARMKEYGIGAQILRDLGVKTILLIGGSNNALIGLEAFDLKINGFLTANKNRQEVSA